MAPLLHLVFWRKGRFLAIPRRYQDEDRNRCCSWIWRAEGLLSWVKEPVMNSSSLALICGIGFFLRKKSNKWRIPSRRELELSRTGLISQTLPNPSALWKCFPHPSALLRLSLRRQNPRPHHRQEIIPKESLSIDTMSRNLDWMLDLEYYSVCLFYSFFTQGLRKSHTISHSSYL